MSLAVGSKVGHYEIRSLLGEGGMGQVYLAFDTRLRRRVALKLLSGSELKQNQLLRFEQEAYAVSALNHPNILTIYEIGTTQGSPFIATEFINGVTLREHLRNTQIELREALNIAIQVGSAVAAAHEARIIHRDIKPENIMVRPDGYIKVLDFGLAKLSELEIASADPEAETIRVVKSEPGLIIGTTWYMSPEQARSFEVDERTDIWSLGVLLFEMVAGKVPFDGSTRTDVLASILKTEPPVLSRVAKEAPAELQRIVRKTLRKEKRERYQSAKDLVIDLKSLLSDIENRRQSDSGVQEQLSSVAILPFRNLTNDSSVQFYEFALADAVITELVRLRSLVVRPSSAIARYLDHAKDPLEAGRELKVDAILAASFLHAGSRVRVTAQLLDVANGNILWGDRIDSEAHDIITVQDIIAKHIVAGLQLTPGLDESISLAAHGSANFQAYQEYLRGRDRVGKYIYHTMALADVDAAINHFQRAIEIDPKFALAHCGLGGCYIQRVLKGAAKFDDVVRAREAFDKGLAIDPHIAEARVYMVYVFAFQGEKQKARDAIAKLRLEMPNDARVQWVSAVMYRLAGEYDKALKSYDRASELNPAEQVVTSWGRARVLMYQGRYDEALLELDQARAAEPDHPLVNAIRAQVLLVSGKPEMACEVMQEVLRQNPQIDGLRPLLAQCLSAVGKHEEARAQLTERVKEVACMDHDIPYWVATAYLMEGETDEALAWLEKAISLGNENLPWFRNNPAWEELHDDARFRELMQGIEVGRAKGN
jgi:eukaryotic-like serine/threonine-protein kinase